MAGVALAHHLLALPLWRVQYKNPSLYLLRARIWAIDMDQSRAKCAKGFNVRTMAIASGGACRACFAPENIIFDSRQTRQDAKPFRVRRQRFARETRTPVMRALNSKRIVCGDAFPFIS